MPPDATLPSETSPLAVSIATLEMSPLTATVPVVVSTKILPALPSTLSATDSPFVELAVKSPTVISLAFPETFNATAFPVSAFADIVSAEILPTLPPTITVDALPSFTPSAEIDFASILSILFPLMAVAFFDAFTSTTPLPVIIADSASAENSIPTASLPSVAFPSRAMLASTLREEPAVISNELEIPSKIIPLSGSSLREGIS